MGLQRAGHNWATELYRSQREKKEKRGAENISEDAMAENLPHLEEEIYKQI